MKYYQCILECRSHSDRHGKFSRLHTGRCKPLCIQIQLQALGQMMFEHRAGTDLPADSLTKIHHSSKLREATQQLGLMRWKSLKKNPETDWPDRAHAPTRGRDSGSVIDGLDLLKENSSPSPIVAVAGFALQVIEYCASNWLPPGAYTIILCFVGWGRLTRFVGSSWIIVAVHGALNPSC
eukprot:5018657-Amphidinium_carterae.1